MGEEIKGKTFHRHGDSRISIKLPRVTTAVDVNAKAKHLLETVTS